MAPKKVEEPPPEEEAPEEPTGPTLPQFWSAAPADSLVSVAAAKAAAASGEGEEEAAPSPTGALEAALALLEDAEIKAAATGADAAADFAAVCGLLGVAIPHPAALTGLAAAASSGTFSLRGWVCDLPTLCALVICGFGKARAVRLWGCGLDADALQLLEAGLASPPCATVESLSLEGNEAALAYAGVMGAPSVKLLSLRCNALGPADAGVLGEALRVDEKLHALSLFGNSFGDDGAVALLGALRTNTTLLSLNLGRTGLGDEAARAVLQMVSEIEGDDAKPDDEEYAPGEEEGEAGPPPPNKTLTALNLSSNRICSAGRAALDQAQAVQPSLSRLELSGNPCVSCGPTASLSASSRAAIVESWNACVAEAEAAMSAALIGAALAAVPIARALFGLPEAADDEAEGDEPAPSAPSGSPSMGRASAASGALSAPSGTEEEAAAEPDAAVAAKGALLVKAIGAMVGQLGERSPPSARRRAPTPPPRSPPPRPVSLPPLTPSPAPRRLARDAP